MAVIKEFRTTVVLTLATGVTMADMTMSDVHELMSWLSGGRIWSHQMRAVLADATRAAQEALGEAWEPYDGDRETHVDYAARMVAKVGETVAVAPAAKPFHREDAVIADAVELVGGDFSKVAVIGGGDA